MYRFPRWVILLALLPVLAGTGCSDKAATPAPNPPQPPFANVSALDRQVLTASNAFGFELFNQLLSEQSPGDNVFISPLSVAVALAMTYNGADAATKQQMAQVLRFDGMTDEQINEACRTLMKALVSADPKVTFEIANSIWYRLGQDFSAEFLQTNQTYFDARISGLDFSQEGAADVINQWVKDKTHDKISGIVPKPIPWEVVMYLINAIYFKGTWVTQFDEAETADAPFHLHDGSATTCRMMSQKADFAFRLNDSLQAVTMPYGAGFFNMTVVMPREGYSLDNLAAAFDDDTWNTWLGGFHSGTIDLFLPRFKFAWEASLNETLKALGMEDAFASGTANFARMRAANDLFISNVRHKSFVEVNEEGTEAAAVTSVEISLTSMPPEDPVLLFDRPFLFIIWEKDTHAVLFMGRVMDPVV